MHLLLSTSRAASVALLVAFLALAGCDSSEPDDDDDPPTSTAVGGTYAGTANVDGIAITLTLTLAETGNNLTGSGTLRSSEVVSVSASGTRVGTDFNLTLSNSAFKDLNYAGTVQSSGAVLSGRLNGSGFDNVQITLNRN